MDSVSLFNGATGIKANTLALQSVADNVANLNTSGYKSTRVNFSDVLYESIALGTSELQQVGTGTLVSTQNLMNQADFEQTDNVTDLAISGGGFFTVRAPEGTGDVEGDFFYSRAGQFSVDGEGYFINNEGYYLQGFEVDEDGEVSATTLGDLQVPTQIDEGASTTLVELGVNLNAADENTHAQTEVIVPTESDTFNYGMGFSVYDSDRTEHTLSVFYQRLDSYTGAEPADSESVWKAAVYEVTDGAYYANPTYPDNNFYLHFDTDGHLAGLSWGALPTGDAYTSDGTVLFTSSNVSDVLGEELVYTGAEDEQTFRTTAAVSFTGAVSAGNSVTVGSEVFTFSSAMSDTDAATWLAEQINQDSSNSLYAIDDGAGGVTLYTASGNTFDLSSSGSNITVNDDTTLDDVVSVINSGAAATGALYVDIAGLSGGETVTIDGNIFTFSTGTPGAGEFTTVAELNTLVDALAGVSSTTYGDNIYITAADSGSAGNEITMASDDSSNLVVSGAALMGGVDGSSTTEIEASATEVGNQWGLDLARTDTGDTATITVGASTLGQNLGLSFDAYTQTSIASDGGGTAETGGDIDLTFDFGDAGAQAITLDYTPGDSSATTQSAGGNDTFYFLQDGFAIGYLTDLSISSDGMIKGIYSNGREQYAGMVGLTNFISPGELERYGDNLWAATEAAGDPLVGQPGDTDYALGDIESNALEVSDVDLANEFVNMINYQRAFQASSKSISTSDDMMKTAIDLVG